MPLTKRQLTLIILIALIALAAVLSAGLSNLELRPGKIHPGESVLDISGSTVTSWMWFLEKYELFLKLLLLLAPVAVIISILTPKGRRGLLTFAIIIFLVFIFRQIPFGEIELDQPKMEIQGQLQFKEHQDNAEAVSLPEPPVWLVLIISIAVSLSVLGIAYVLWKRFKPEPSPLKQVAIEVKKTIEDLRAGADLREGVIRCYFEMISVINEHRGIKRKQTMTVREFEVQLEKAGLPGCHIERLTRLFEKVRYGSKDLDKTEEQEALNCLTNILKVCEEGKG